MQVNVLLFQFNDINAHKIVEFTNSENRIQLTPCYKTVLKMLIKMYYLLYLLLSD